MAGEFDDLIPQGAAPAGGGGTFDDLVPTGPTPEQQRSERLRKIARAGLSQTPGASDLYSDAFTLGLMKPVSGLATGAANWATGKSGFGEGYQAGTGAYQEMLDEASKNAGWGGTAANVAGSITAGGPARGIVQQGLGRLIGQTATLGGIEGAARSSEDLASAAKGAVGGAAAAGTTAGTIGAGLRAPGFRQRRAAAREAARGTPPVELRQQARGLYRQLDEAGVAYDNNQAADLADSAIADLRQNQWSPRGIHAPLNGVIQQIEELRGQPVSLERLQDIREQLGAEAGSNEPQIRRIAGRLIASIDGFVRQVDPAMSAIPGEQIGPMWGEARRLWRAANTAEDIGWRLGKAESRAARTNSGTNVENPIRQNIGQVLDKAEQPRRFNPYSPDEIAQMERVVEGTPTRNFLRGFGNRFGGSGPMAQAQGTVLGTGLGLGSMLSGQEPGAAAMAGAGTYAGLWGAGKAAKLRADRMAENEADALMRLITTGSLEMGPRQVPAGPPTREALARLMREQALARGAGIYAGGL